MLNQLQMFIDTAPTAQLVLIVCGVFLAIALIQMSIFGTGGIVERHQFRVKRGSRAYYRGDWHAK